MFSAVAKFWNEFVYQNCVLKTYTTAKDGKSFRKFSIVILYRYA